MRTLAFIMLALTFAGCSTTPTVPGTWQYTGGPYAQNISTVMVGIGTPRLLYAGLTNGETYRSTDAGTTWVRISIIPGGPAIRSFAQNPDSTHRIYAATDGGIFASDNGGHTWRNLTVDTAATRPRGARVIAFDPWKTNVLYAGLEGGGIVKSVDEGATWTAANGTADLRLMTGDVYDIEVDASRPDYVYAALSGTGVIRSTDAGSTWTRLTEEFTPTSAQVTRIAIHPGSKETLAYGTTSGAISRSINAGRTWSPSKTSAEGDRISTFAPDPGNPEVLYAGSGKGILRSTDFGTSWSSIQGTLPGIDCAVVASGTSEGTLLFAYGEGIGLQRSEDGAVTWRHADAGLGGSTVSLIGLVPKSGRLFACVGNTILTYERKSASWIPSGGEVPGDAITSLAFDPDAPTTLFAATSAGAFKSSDGGLSWVSATRGLRSSPDFIDAHPWIHTRMFMSGEEGLSVSTNKGRSWVQTKPVTSHFHVRSLSFMPTNAGIIYGATANSGVIATDDGGFTWDINKYGLGSTDIVAVTFDDRDPNLLYAWNGGGEGYRSTNRGVEWNRYAPPWKPSDKVLIAYDHATPSSVVAFVNSRDLYYSSSGGGTWFPIPGKELNAEPVCMSWNAGISTLYVGTKDEGAFRISLAKILAERR